MKYTDSEVWTLTDGEQLVIAVDTLFMLRNKAEPAESDQLDQAIDNKLRAAWSTVLKPLIARDAAACRELARRSK